MTLSKILLQLVVVLMICCGISLQQKSYTIWSIDVSQAASGCVVFTTETYMFEFTGGTYSTLGIPIHKNALYTTAPIISVSSVTSAPSNLSVTYSIVNPTSGSDPSFKYILLNFTPYTGNATFTVSYSCTGYMDSTDGISTMRWASQWSGSVIRSITLQQTLPSSRSVVPSPTSGSVIGSTVRYRTTNVPINNVWIASTRCNYDVSGCSAKIGGSSSNIYLIFIGVGVVVAFFVVFVVCVIFVRIRRRRWLLEQAMRIGEAKTAAAPTVTTTATQQPYVEPQPQPYPQPQPQPYQPFAQPQPYQPYPQPQPYAPPYQPYPQTYAPPYHSSTTVIATTVPSYNHDHNYHDNYNNDHHHHHTSYSSPAPPRTAPVYDPTPSSSATYDAPSASYDTGSGNAGFAD